MMYRVALVALLAACSVMLMFDAPGTKSIRIHGRHVNIDVDDEIAFEFSVVVQVAP